MATMKNGIHGPIRGKVGNIVGSSWRGINYIKSLPRRTKPPTEKELANRFVFAYTQNWLQPIAKFLKVGFKGYSKTVFGVNAAKSYLYQNALIKDGFNSQIDASLMKVSIGSLPLSKDIQFEKTNPRELTFTWSTDHVDGGNPHDQIMILGYCFEDKDKMDIDEVFISLSGQFRKTGIEKVEIDPDPRNPDLSYHVYVAFCAEDRSRQSDSIYLGVVQI